MTSPSLLESVRGLLERTYRLESGLPELAPFLIGDRGYRRYAEQPSAAAGTAGGGARTLVRETDGAIRAAIYFPDELIRRLEAHPPQRGVRPENVSEFATFVEEIDHLLVLAECARQGRSTRLFELELHANVSKHLVLSRFLSGNAGSLTPARRCWLRRELFTAARYCDQVAEVRRRYEEAARWALRFLDALTGLSGAERLAALREFHRQELPGKLRLVEQLAG